MRDNVTVTLNTKKNKINNNNNNNNSISSTNNIQNSKYDKLIDTIKRYSNSEKQISSGLAKKALRQTIGKDERTVNKYLKILQDDDIIYSNSRLGLLYDVQS